MGLRDLSEKRESTTLDDMIAWLDCLEARSVMVRWLEDDSLAFNPPQNENRQQVLREHSREIKQAIVIRGGRWEGWQSWEEAHEPCPNQI